MKKVGVISTGGTIAMGARHLFDWVDYGDSGIVNDLDLLLPRFEGLVPDIQLIGQSFRTIGSVAIGWSDWVKLLSTAKAMIDDMPELTGIVITHGTATLEETAFFLHLTWEYACPIILVGAQRPIDTHGSDALSNVRAAIVGACDPALRNLGVLVAMNSTIFHAPDVTKTANFSLDAFESPFGPIAQMDQAGQIKFIRRPTKLYRPNFEPLPEPVRVDIMISYSGSDGCIVECFRNAGCKAIVVAALPPGRCAAGERAALVKAAKEGVMVIFSSRAWRDGLPIQDYNIVDAILTAGSLAPHKARILAMLALGAEFSHEQLQVAFMDAL